MEESPIGLFLLHKLLELRCFVTHVISDKIRGMPIGENNQAMMYFKTIAPPKIDKKIEMRKL
jgi:hypothetical protein